MFSVSADKRFISGFLAFLLAVTPCFFLAGCSEQKSVSSEAAATSSLDIYILRDEPVTDHSSENTTVAPTVAPTAAPTEEPSNETVPDSEAESTTGTMHADGSEDLPTEEPSTLTAEEIIAINPLMKGVMDRFGGIVDVCGFAYDPEQDIFYSIMYPLQRFGGYNSFYDFAAYHVGLYYNTRKIHFNYSGKDWMVQLWKGQYGITVGAEIGTYYKDETQSLPQYETVLDEDMVILGFTLYKNNEEYFHRGPERHWWLTGFKLLDAAIMLQLTMVAYFDWDNLEQADAFETGVKREALTDITYAREGTEFWLTWRI